jgi:hypothetical protein
MMISGINDARVSVLHMQQFHAYVAHSPLFWTSQLYIFSHASAIG